MFGLYIQSMKPHSKKPFPGELVVMNKCKPRHLFAFWVLCNNFDSDEDGWIHVTRREWNRVASLNIPVEVHNPTLILESLHTWGFIHFESERRDPLHRNGASHYRIRIADTAWDIRPEVETEPLPEELLARKRQFYRDRYERRKALALLS